MANYEFAINHVLSHEGGYVNDEDDRGGETKYGISKRQYPDLDIASLTIEDAKRIYHADYWVPGRYEEIIDQAVATKAFDLAVNMGPKSAHKCLQRAVRACGIALKEDGAIGPRTLLAINTVDEAMLLGALRSEAYGHYQKLVAKNDRLEKFREGWKNRAYA